MKLLLLLTLIVPFLALSATAQPGAQRRPVGRRASVSRVKGIVHSAHAPRALSQHPRGDAATPPTQESSIVPGQLVRSEGLGFKIEQPSVQSWFHRVEGGDRISYDQNKGYALTNHLGVFTGPKDTLPPPNPGTAAGGRATGNNTITPNNVPPVN